MLISGVMLGEFHQDHPAPQKHDHVVLHMEGGARVTFNDARRFGAMDLLPVARGLAAAGADFTLDIFGAGRLEADLRAGLAAGWRD